MTIPLGEKQYELGGVVFGLGCPVAVKEDGWTPGGAALRSDDKEQPVSDGIRFGRTRTGSATWGFSMFANADTEEEAWDSVSELAEAWGADDIRETSEAVMPLRYRVAGRTRRIYGQPRRWTPTPNNLSLGGRIDVTADFASVDHLIYDDELQSHTVTIAPPAPTDAGIIFPTTLPYVTNQSSSTRQDQITIGGRARTPITVVVNGPVAGARVEIGEPNTPQRAGFVVALRDPVLDDDPVTVDGSPWVRAATKQSGGGVVVSPRETRISQMWLPPGEHNVTFTGVDPTGTASVEILWRDASRSPR